MIVGFVLISASPCYKKSIYNSLLSENMVKEINSLFGEYDLIIKIEGKTNKDIGQFVINRIRATEGVIDTKTLISSLIK